MPQMSQESSTAQPARSPLGRLAREKALLYRWAEVRELQASIDLAEGRLSPPADPMVAERLKRDFDRVFPSPVRMLAFWDEVRDLTWAQFAGESPWQTVSAMARDLAEHGRLDAASAANDSLPSAASRLLRDHAQSVRGWPDQGGIDFVLQQGLDGGLWTSIPQWASDIQGVIRSVQAGYLTGHPRWAVAIGCDGSEPAFIFGIDDRGREMSASAVQGHVLAVKSYELPSSAGRYASVEAVARSRAA
jgi:hypothetical protein